MLLVRLSVNSRLLINFGGVKGYVQIFDSVGGQCPNPHIVQLSTVFQKKDGLKHKSFYISVESLRSQST